MFAVQIIMYFVPDITFSAAYFQGNSYMLYTDQAYDPADV